MTTATTLAVILAFCLGAAVIIAMRHYYGAKHIQKKYNAVCAKLKRYKAADRDCKHCVRAESGYNRYYVSPVCDLQPKANRGCSNPQHQQTETILFDTPKRYGVREV